MKKWVSRQHGQALVELAAVLFLFGLFIIGVLQLAQLGMGQVRAQEAARRAAWLRNRLNNAPLQDAQFESMGAKLIASEGGRDDMTSVVVEVQVPAYGFFRVIRPNGFQVRAQAAVTSYIPKPITVEEIKDKAFRKLGELLGKK